MPIKKTEMRIATRKIIVAIDQIKWMVEIMKSEETYGAKNLLVNSSASLTDATNNLETVYEGLK